MITVERLHITCQGSMLQPESQMLSPQGGLLAKMAHQSLDTQSCEISCSLCAAIRSGSLDSAENILQVNDVDTTAVHSPLYLLVKQYSSFLTNVSLKLETSRCSAWKSDTVYIGTFRTQVMSLMRQLLKKGFSPIAYAAGIEETVLMCSVGTHDEDLVRLLLEHGADASIMCTANGMNALALAIILNEAPILKLLLSFGGKINETCCQGLTPLQLSMNKSVEVSKVLLQNGADINQVMNMHGSHVVMTKPPLMHAVETNNIYLASILLEHGEDVNQSYGQAANSPIHLAVLQGNTSMVQLLIQYGANLNKRNKRGHTPLGMALHQEPSGASLCETLLSAGCSLKKASMINVFQRHFPPLHVAAFLGHSFHQNFITCLLNRSQQNALEIDVALGLDLDTDISDERHFQANKAKKGLICSERRVDLQKDGELSFVNMQALDKSTALFMATMGGNIEIAHLLHSSGGNPHLTCCFGNLLHASVMASKNGEEMLKFALQFDLDVNLLNDDGNTPLILAARNNNPNICQRLVHSGALLNIRDGRYGETALSVSVYFGFEDNAEMLLCHGADPDIPDSRGSTALYWAIFNCRQKTLQLLLQAGVKLAAPELGQYPKHIKIMKNTKIRELLQNYVSEPRSLQEQCRLIIRRQLVTVHAGKSIMSAITTLPIPRKMKDFLALRSS